LTGVDVTVRRIRPGDGAVLKSVRLAAGIAAKLVEAVVGWAGEHNATSVELSVTRGNEAAVRLYEAAGFRATGEHQSLPSDRCKDELRMRRALG
jgi:ribosomal protein S18 acetylase RimI-like enzyme